MIRPTTGDRRLSSADAARNSWRRAVAVLALSWMASLSMMGCADSQPRRSGTSSAGSASQEEPSSPVPSGSVDQTQGAPVAARRTPALLGRCPGFELKGRANQPFTDEHLAGRSAVICSLTAADDAGRAAEAEPLRQLQRELRQRGLANSVRIVSIVAEPPSVTSSELERIAKTLGVDGENWVLLTGSATALQALDQEALPQALAGAEDGYAPGKLVVIDPQGDLRGVSSIAGPADLRQLLDDLTVTLDERVVVLDNALVRGDKANEVLSPPWLEPRRQAQQAAIASSQVFHNFSFADRSKQSGITFRHRVVDDAGRSLVSAHYDHGNGVAIADVDRDGLQDVFLVNQVGPSQLWRNVGGGKFENVTEAAGVVLPPDRIGVSASFADIDNDGDPDLYVTVVRRGNVLFENLGSGTFRDISRESGLDYQGHSSSAEFFDFDRDGLLDLFLVNVGIYTTDKVRPVTKDRYSGPDQGEYTYHVSNPDAFAAHLKPQRAERSNLYRNLGGNRFEDVSEAMKITDLNWTGDASPLDVNDDGWPDLYLTCMQGHDVYYENVEGRHFELKSRRTFPLTPWGTMGIKVFDYDNDGRFDIFLTDMHTDMRKDLGPMEEKQKIPRESFESTLMNTDGKHIWGNALFHKVGPGKYAEVSDNMGTETYWPWGVSVGDLNADGFEDVFVSASMNFPYRYGINSVLLNDHGRKFVDAEFVVGVEPRRARRTAVPWFELDFAGRDASHPVRQALRAQGVQVSRAVVWGAIGTRSSVIFDIDNDGDLDIITNDFNSPPLVLVNNRSEQEPGLRFLKVRLRGTRSNRDGLGAVVRITAGELIQTKVYDGQSGYLSQSSYPLYFGVGNQEAIDRVEVTWPSGIKQIVPGPIEVNSTLEMQEAE